MGAFSASVGPLIALIDWKTVVGDLGTDSAKKGAQTLLGKLKPHDGEKAAKQMADLFTERFRKNWKTRRLSSPPSPATRIN